MSKRLKKVLNNITKNFPLQESNIKPVDLCKTARKMYFLLKKENCYVCNTSGKMVQLMWCTACGKAICQECGVVADIEEFKISCVNCDKENFKRANPELEYYCISTRIIDLYEPARTRLMSFGIKPELEIMLSPLAIKD